MKIRTKFRTVSLCIVLIVVGVVAAIYAVAKKEVTTKVHNHLLLVADLQRERVKEVLSRNFERLEQVASNKDLQGDVGDYIDDLQEDTREEVNKILVNARDSVEEGVFTEVCIIDLKGKVIGSSVLDNIDSSFAEQTFFLEREHYKDEIDEEDGHAVSFGVEDGILEVILSAPFRNQDSTVVGLIVIRTAGENVSATTIGDDEPVQTLLVKEELDQTIVVLTPPENAGPVTGAADDAPLIRAAKKDVGFFPEARDEFRSVPVLAVTSRLDDEGVGLGFVAKMDRAIAFRGLDKIRSYSLVLLALALVAMELAFLAIGKAILKPIQQLAETANEISGGDLSRRVEVKSNDEIGELGRDFNQMTERLVEANTGLERKVEERTAELEQSNADLAQFAYVASHDLKEPLRMVTSYVQLLERRIGKSLDEESKEFMGFAVDGAKRMRGLIDDLLAFSRVGAKRKPLEKIGVQKIVDAALMNLKIAIDESDAEVEVGEMPELMADPSQLTQLFQNLFANAIKFRGDKVPRLSVKAEREGELWNFRVSDNGIGIEKDFLGQIFLIFQRLHSRSEYEGTGIGLAVCKKIVERHGGKIAVESVPGEGSTFLFGIRAIDA